ncbi:SDR family NAD(P)-dependent oxidoreductase [Streptomyces sp. Go40/10]|uniref:SDR family NAD(P)-dependent oxidoreductase n=1 Tax=Streptomyces sp. Go40/10 TaxID=2825844 RepID=UPI001E3909EE|nr:SDR family NAD(P)-dependent oxidoreductase [Streptomyces sp. Go40/10]UFR06751.1 SDR family NAD(P)-dependent oxidoreductase [Streptomyces sp. Go40/10]
MRSESDLRRFLQETLGGVLGTDPTSSPDHLPFVELGLDSISCVVWLREINRALGLSLTVAEVCGHPTFGELAALIEGVMGDLMSGTTPRSSAARVDGTHGRDAIADHVRQSLAEELELPAADVADDVPFVELGLDSITGVTWTRKLNTHFGLALSATQVYSHPTVADLAAHVAGCLEGADGAPEGVSEAASEAPAAVPASGAAPASGPVEDTLTGWLRASLARELELAESDIDDDTPFVELGLDSITGVTWTRSVNTRLGLALSATTVYGHPTIAELAAHLTRDHGASLPEPAAAEEKAPAGPPAPPARPAAAPTLAAASIPAAAAAAAPAPAAPDRAPRPSVDLVDIAVIGMSGAFPQAADLDEFWANIVAGRDCVTEVPPSRWAVDRFYDERPGTPGKSYSKWMGVLENAHHFDPQFFTVSPSEAEAMDPQQRLLLQESWRCVEDAGYNPEALSGTDCGVFIGCSVNGYGGRVDESELSAHQNLGTNSAIMASRISYTLNLKGPCLSIDTSCSSSLVALAAACDSLCLGDSDTALAGGVWVIPGPGVHVAMSQLRALSPTGRCHAFDDRADGFVPAEGVGVLLLKRLPDALADGDRIHAVIKGWGVGQDGRSNGITAPNAEAQAALQGRVYDRFGIDPADIELVEAHGTGTALGDPVEIDGLVQSFGARTDRTAYCAIGSVKSNIGHTACAAGVAGTLKTVLSLKHATLPPTIQYDRLNPHIDLIGTPFYVNTEERAWPDRGRPRLAAVSSFGYSGTNAHLVLAEAPPSPAHPGEREAPGTRLVALSARTGTQLRDQARRLLAHLRTHPQESLRALSCTLLLGRKHFRHRLALVADTTAQVTEALENWLHTGADPAVRSGDRKPERPAGGFAGQPSGAADQVGRRQLEALAEQYAEGRALPFDTLFESGRPARTSLPTYPFAADPYWLDPEPARPDATAPQGEPLWLEPRWEPADRAATEPGDAPADDHGHTVWLVGDDPDGSFARALPALLPAGAELRTFRTGTAAPDEDYRRLTHTLLTGIRALTSTGAAGGHLLQVVVAGHDAPQARLMAGVSGLLRTARLEHPRLRAQYVEHLDAPTATALDRTVRAALRHPGEAEIRRTGGETYVRRLAELPVSVSVDTAALPWRDGGVHLITGGLGGLGLHLARDLSSGLTEGVLVLVGRSAPTPDTERTLAALRRPGLTVEYRRTDLTDRAAVRDLVDGVRGRHGALHTIVHCAGVLRDGPLASKQDTDVHAVLAPKVSGLVHLDEATRDLPLDRFVVFSSNAAAFGSAGQADYAAANGFLDAYVVHRNELAARGLRSGRAVSVSWPLWADGGMRVDAAGLDRLARLGVTPLPTPDGLHALRTLLASGRERTLVLHGDREALLARLAPLTSTAPGTAPATGTAPGSAPATGTAPGSGPLAGPRPEAGPLTGSASKAARPAEAAGPDAADWERTLVAEIAAQLGLPAAEIEPDGELGEYGFDSISLTQLADRLNDQHGLALAPTAFFEHPTPRRLAAHLADRHTPAPSRTAEPALSRATDPAPSGTAEPAPRGTADLDAVTAGLAAEVSAQLGLPAEEIDADEELGEYGFDSISLTELAGRLGERYGLTLAPTVFFEHRTLRALAAHLVDTHGAEPARFHGTAPSERGTTTVETPGNTRLREGREPSAATTGRETEPIAVIGMSGSFPQAPDLTAFWDNLRQGRDCITEIPGERWDHLQYPAGGRWGGFLDAVDRFDPLFFGISPREATAMDPQQRLLLTHVWQALEDAGHAPSSLAGSDTAVLIGTAPSGYGTLLLDGQHTGDGYAATGVSGSVGPNRVSYLLDLHGPSEPVETACSSSLVAVHRAVELLRSGASDLALAGGVNTIVSPDLHIGYSRAGMLSEDGRCKTFSARADGYVRGEGVGVLVLKPLSLAERDGDRVHGVILATAENHGGRAHSLTAPNPRAQADLLTTAYRRAGIDPRTVTYVEAHGTGTELGDPVELGALRTAFATLCDEVPDTLGRPARCGLGSVKSNIGHLELAAGVAGMIKTLLQMRHGELVESLHCHDLNPYLDFTDSPFEVVRERRPWQRLRDADGAEVPRRAGVSSFGFGGVNAHVVLEEYQGRSRPEEPAVDATPELIVLSARTPGQLAARARDLLAHLDDDRVATPRLTDLAYTLQTGRDAMEERLATRVSSLTELRRRLAQVTDADTAPEGWHRGSVPRGAVAAAARDTERLAASRGWIDAEQYDRVLDRWAAGHPVDWERLHTGRPRPRRIGLPAYPFADERYWAGRGTGRPTAAAPAAQAAPAGSHPLLGRALPDGTTTRYETRLDGSEPFLRDHRVRGAGVLPGAAHLEMAHAAVGRLVGEDRAGRIRLDDIVWLRPAVCGADGLRLSLDVRRVSDDVHEYALHSVDGDGRRVLCSQGRARFTDTPGSPVPPLDELKSACADTVFTADEIYDRYGRVGMEYGPAHRSVTWLGTGTDPDGRPQVLAALRLPAEAEHPESYHLHPSIVDGALQATLGLGLTAERADDHGGRPALPFALQHLRASAPTPVTAYAWIRHQDGSRPDASSARLDVTLLDERGRVCAELTGLSARVLRGEPGGDGLAPARPEEPLGVRALRYVREQLATALEVAPDRLDVDTPLEHYGMDSMMAMELTRHLEGPFGPLPKTLFFEVRTIRALSDHFAEEYPRQLRAALGAEAAVPAAADPDAPHRAPTASGQHTASRQPTASGQPAASRQAADTTAAATADIAIIGVAGRYPEAADLDEFWENLRSGRDCIREVPASRWDHRQYPAGGRWGGFLDGVDEFDPLFFHISPREAEYLDPQERLFLQCVHHTLEDAGYTGELLARRSADDDAAALQPHGKVGVFVGVMYEEYQLHGAQAQARGHQVALSGNPASIANRVSYFFDFHGPSMAVDTMCSSSLTAIHLACEAIRSGQCASAIAGGVNVSVHPNKYLMLAQGRFTAGDGRCRSFGEGGDGYVPGEGVGAVLLKPLDRAIADGDHIYGVVKGSALNHGGRTHGFSVPSPVAQGDVIARALAEAGVEPRELGYLEAHGTGTSLGDPIEIAGLVKAFRKAGDGTLPDHCAIGSVKSNIGHCESAAGIAAVTKVLLQMKHRALVPSLHSATPNPHIDFARTPFRVQQVLEPWRQPTVVTDGERRALPRTAGISSFGAGGSNAHLVIAEYRPAADRSPAAPQDPRPALIVLSAQSAPQLVEQARRLAARTAELTDDDLTAIAWTLQSGRVAMEERLAFTADSLASLRRTLHAFTDDPAQSGPWQRGTVRPGEPAPLTPDDARSAVRELWESGDHAGLLRHWAAGIAVDWEALRPVGAPVRRISLPGYPFARERYWLDIDSHGDTDSHGDSHIGTDGHGDTDTGVGTGSDGSAAVAGPPAGLLLLRPVWDAAEASGEPGHAGFAEHHVVLVGRLDAAARDALAGALPESVSYDLVDLGTGPLDEQYLGVSRHLLGLLRGMLEPGLRHEVLLQVVAVGEPGDADRQECFAGLTGLLKTARLENPRLHTQYVDCLDGAAPDLVATRLRAEAARPVAPEIRYRDGRREVRRLTEVTPARPATTPWRTGGVYLITGGTGALGLIAARDIAASAGRATVVLTGRSPLDGDRRRALDELRAAGLRVDHQRVDVTDPRAVQELITHVTDVHGPLTGIVHSAGVIGDGLLAGKEPQDAERVLAPKVRGLVNLDEASRDQPLELFLCFSSTSAAFGNPGQADYAAGNAFMDAFAARRNRLADRGLRSGRTLSVNWPLWEDGGMQVNDATKEQLRRMDLEPLDTDSALHALRVGAAAQDNGLDEGRLVVVSGRRGALLPRLTERADTARPRPGAAAPAAEDAAPAAEDAGPGTDETAAVTAGLQERTVRHLRQRIAAALKLDPARLDADTPLERYGMDSVVATDLIAGLEKIFGPLSKTLFFELQTVRELAAHFVAGHADALRDLVGEPAAPQPRTPRTAPAPAADTEAGQAHPVPGPAPVAGPVPSVPGPSPVAGPVPSAPDPAPVAGAGQDIAIIGVVGRYPQARDLDAFWTNLRAGRDCVTEVPRDRWDPDALFDADRDAMGTSYCRWGGFLDGIDRFDPLFFGISPREAEAMDPQQRLFLETAWDLLEQSGITQETIERRYRRRVGVYVGSMYQMYRAEESDTARAALTAATSYNMIANRVSYFFGLEGPSLAVDSMCSSSAQAVHLACADLLRGEAELAIAGGVNLTVHPDKYIALSQAQLLGSHPGSRSLRDGDGYLPAEAVGAVLLKPLAAALRDGDTVHAVIKGSASLHAGRGGGFMAPSHRTQVAVMRRALERAGATPESVGYVEAAAGGSALSDAVEVSALREVFEGVSEPVVIGSVKSSLGHPEAASGIAQLTKVVLQLRHGELTPLTAVGAPNPNLRWDDTPLEPCEDLTAWRPRRADRADSGHPAPLRALVNSVGAGGSHVSLVIEAAPQPRAPRSADGAAAQLVPLSAQGPERLRATARQLLDFLERDDATDLADLAHTLQTGREALPERFATVVGSKAELREALLHFLDAEEPGRPCTAPLHHGNAESGSHPLSAVLSGAHGEAFLTALLRDGDLDRIAALWAAGAKVPWHALHQGRSRRLVPLPGTAFLRDRYWIGRTWHPETAAAPTAPASPSVPASPSASATRSVPATPSASATPTAPAAPAVPAAPTAPAAMAVPAAPTAPTAPTERTAPAGDLTAYLTGFFAEALGLAAAELPPDKDLHGFGVDSILWSRLQRRLRADLGLDLSTRDILECATLERLAACLAAKHPGGPASGTGEPAADGTRPEVPGEGYGPRAAKARALEQFRQGHVSLEDLKALMKEAPRA